ncbi:MAG: beta-lactamase family protein [Saccharofermentans sp.]|nr:beta-lactamase family protein [Saccharofermentans sp.]
MNKEELHKAVLNSTGNESNICQICAMKDGNIVYEDCWIGFSPSDAVNVMSVTKGVMSLLIGIAVTKGFVKDVDQKVIGFFPDYQVKRGEKTIYDVTLRHLLTMTAPYKYRSEPWTKVCTSDDWTSAALDLLGGRAGITGEFKYATLGIQILSGVIENVTGEKCIDFANRNLFIPLGIPEHVIHGDSSKEDQFDYLMNKSPRKNEWYSDPKDTVTAGWGLCLSARDLAKIGELVLGNGVYEGKVIISEQYINDMTASHVKLGKMFGNMDYGYLWYRPHADRNVFAAIGDGGNVIFVNKESNISVGVTGTFKPRIFDRVYFIEKKVIPLTEGKIV